MRFGQALRALEELRGRGMDHVVLGGGEPFTWPSGAVRLAEAARAWGFHVQAGTNGIALPEGFSRIGAIDRYVLPLESDDAALHDAQRLFPGGHHALVIGRLEQLRTAGKSVTVSTVVSAATAGRLCGLAEWLAGYVTRGGQLHAWHLYRFIPAGRGGARHARHLNLSYVEYQRACAVVKAMALPFAVFKRQDMRHSRTVDFFWYEGERLRVGSEAWGGGASVAQTCPACHSTLPCPSCAR